MGGGHTGSISVMWPMVSIGVGGSFPSWRLLRRQLLVRSDVVVDLPLATVDSKAVSPQRAAFVWHKAAYLALHFARFVPLALIGGIEKFWILTAVAFALPLPATMVSRFGGKSI